MDIPPKTAESEEYHLLTDHLDQSSDLNVTLSQFINPLTKALEKSSPAYSLSSDETSKHLSRAWSSVLLKASETPHDSPKQATLVQFMTRLVQQIPLEKPDQSSVALDDSRIWSDLPLFGQQVRESWNIPLDREIETETKDKWINVNAFVARLTAAYWAVGSGKQDVESWVNASALDFSLYGIWGLRSALEEEEGVGEGRTMDTVVGAGAVWLIYAGEALKGLSETGKVFDGKIARPGGKFREKEWRGFTTERWDVWSHELAKVKTVVQDQDVLALVNKAQEAVK